MTETIWSDPRVRQLINQLVSFVAVLDQDGNVLEVDELALRTAGIGHDDVVGKPFSDAYWWTFDMDVSSRLRRDIEAARLGHQTRREEMVRVANDGRLPIMLRTSPILDPTGKVSEIVVSATDISREKAHERQIAKERERLGSGPIDPRGMI